MLGEQIAPEHDILLEDLALRESLSNRAFNVCLRNDLTSLFRILKYYHQHENFLLLRQIGVTTNNHLIEMCKKYSYLLEHIIELNPMENSVIDFESFSSVQNIIFQFQFKLILSKLSPSAYRLLGKVSTNYNIREIVEKLLSSNFLDNKKLKIQWKSIAELKLLIVTIRDIISKIYAIEPENFHFEFTKSFMEIKFPGSSELLAHNQDSIFTDKDKINVFSLIDLLIENQFLFSKLETEFFLHKYSRNNYDDFAFKQICIRHKIKPQKTRRLKNTFLDNIQNHFMFLFDFTLNNLFDLEIDDSKNLICIDDSMAQKINEEENLSFNTHFYGMIYKIYLQKTHTLLRENDRRYEIRKNHNQYLIKVSLFESYNFIRFFKYLKMVLVDRTTVTYKMNFRKLVHRFYDETCKENWEDIYAVCEEILYYEYKLKADSFGHILIDMPYKKKIRDYVMEVFEQHSDFMSSHDIYTIIKQKYPDYTKNEASIRCALMMNKGSFFFNKKSNTFGLLDWPTDEKKFQGSRIAEIVEEFLLKKQ